jgi:hypothetical protein
MVKVLHDTTSQHTHHRCWTVDPLADTLECTCACCDETDSDYGSTGTDCSIDANYH